MMLPGCASRPTCAVLAAAGYCCRDLTLGRGGARTSPAVPRMTAPLQAGGSKTADQMAPGGGRATCSGSAQCARAPESQSWAGASA